MSERLANVDIGVSGSVIIGIPAFGASGLTAVTLRQVSWDFVGSIGLSRDYTCFDSCRWFWRSGYLCTRIDWGIYGTARECLDLVSTR